MSDDKENIGHPDRDLISMKEPYEADRWAKKFGITKEELQDAVDKKGHSVKTVEEYLKSKK